MDSNTTVCSQDIGSPCDIRGQRNQRCLRLVESARMLNVNNSDYVLGYSPKWQKTVAQGHELLNKLCYYCFLCAQKVFSLLCKIMVEPLMSHGQL